MGCGETYNLELAPMDFYTSVTLRASSARYRTSKRIAPVLAESQRCINGKHDGLNLLLEVMEGDLHNPVTETRETSEACTEISSFIGESNLSAELTAVEMLKTLSKGHGFGFGDLVWGKIRSHPWWPGQIYDESLSSISTCFRKEKGRVLVAFFGDYTYAWLHPKHVVPFASHFDMKSKASKDVMFLNAVEQALSEIKKRSALGLSCKCPNRFVKFKDCEVEGFFRVDVAGHGGGSTYSIEQIKKARDGFRPQEMLTFLEESALRPKFAFQKDVSSIRNVATILAYRKAASVESGETYAEAFEVTEAMAHEGSKGFTLKNNVRTSNKRGIADYYQGKKIMNKKTKTKSLDCDPRRGDQITETPPTAAPQETPPTKGTDSWIEDTESTMLVISFSSEARMPSASELKAKFTCFGPFNESGVRVLEKSSTCQVVFACRTDAEAAYHHALQNRALFGKLEASYHLQGSEWPFVYPTQAGPTRRYRRRRRREVVPFTPPLSKEMP